MALSEYVTQIALLNAQIKQKNDQITELNTSAADWLKSSKMQCSGTKAHKAACQVDRANDKAKSDSYYAQAAAISQEVAALNVQLKSYQDAMAAENKTSVTLADKGISMEAEKIKAQGLAQAAVDSSTITANAQATAIAQKSSTDAKNSANSNNVMLFAVVAVVAVVLVVVVMKLRKVKKGKK